MNIYLEKKRLSWLEKEIFELKDHFYNTKIKEARKGLFIYLTRIFIQPLDT